MCLWVVLYIVHTWMFVTHFGHISVNLEYKCEFSGEWIVFWRFLNLHAFLFPFPSLSRDLRFPTSLAETTHRKENEIFGTDLDTHLGYHIYSYVQVSLYVYICIYDFFYFWFYFLLCYVKTFWNICSSIDLVFSCYYLLF